MTAATCASCLQPVIRTPDGRALDAQQGDLFAADVEPLPDEAADRSRATMWDVPRFAERHPYRYIVVENVIDARHWIYWDAWLMAMSKQYDHQVVYLNSMHAASESDDPAPQSRDRMYVVFWRHGERAPDLRVTPAAWCVPCDTQVDAYQCWKKPLSPGGRYRAQYVYRCPTCRTVVEPYVLPAAVAIDWEQPGERIGDRTKPLAEKTRARIAAGLRRYARPIHLEAGGNQYDSADPKHRQHGSDSGYMRAWPMDSEPLRTLHTALTKALAYPPLLVPVEGRDGKTAQPADQPMRTMTTRNETGLAVPPMLVPAGGTWNDDARPVTDPMRARTTRDSEALVCPPFIAELRGGGSKHRRITDPLATVTAAGNHHGLVQPPAMVMRNNGSRGDGGEMCTPVGEPLRTLTTAGHQSLVSWAALYGYDTGDLRSLRRPLPTQTTVQGDALLHGDVPDVDECLFRMLEPQEIGRGMAFDVDYVVLGNKREQVRQYGNAVTPPAAALLLGRVLAAMGGGE